VESDELAAVQELEPNGEGTSEMIADRPGPNNEPLSNEGGDEELIADVDQIGDEDDLADETASA